MDHNYPLYIGFGVTLVILGSLLFAAFKNRPHVHDVDQLDVIIALSIAIMVSVTFAWMHYGGLV